MNENSWWGEMKTSVVKNGACILGFGLCLAWFYSAFFSCSLVSVSYANLNHGSDTYWSVAVLFAAISALACLRFPIFARRKTCLIVSVVGCAVGTLTIRYGYYSLDYHVLFYWLGGILAGTGFGALALAWISCLQNRDAEDIEIAVPAAFLVAFLMYFLIFAMKADWAAWMMCVFVLTSLVFLFHELSKGLSSDMQESVSGERKRVGLLLRLITNDMKDMRLLVLYLMVWFSFGFFRVFTAPIYPTDRELYYCIPFSVALVIAIAIVGFAIKYARAIDLLLAFKWVLALAPLGYAIVFAMPENPLNNLVGYAIGCTSVLVMTMQVHIVMAKTARKENRSAQGTMAGFLVAQGLGVFLGVAVATYLFGLFNNSIPVVWCFVVLTLLVGVGMLSVPHVREEPTPDDRFVEPSDSANQAGDDPFERFANRCGFSPREKEVAQLLLAGHSRPRIRDELFVSLNTVGTHTKSIYAKANVHSQWELLEAVKRGDSQDVARNKVA